jgi:hypothetical protein
VVKALKTSDNTPLAVMRTGQLRRNDGSLAQGMQTANITVRSDAEYAINILGTVIHPGKLKKYSLTSELVKTLRFRFFRLSTGLRVKATSSSSSHNLTNYRRPPPLLWGWWRFVPNGVVKSMQSEKSNFLQGINFTNFLD